VKIVKEEYQTIQKKEEKSKLESSQNKDRLPIVYADDIVPVSEQLGLLERSITDYYLTKFFVSTPTLPDADDRALLFQFIEKYIKSGKANDVFWQVVEKRFNEPLDFRKIYYLTEGVRLIEPYQGKWRLSPSLGRPYLTELLKRCGKETENLIDKISGYESPEEKKKEDVRSWQRDSDFFKRDKRSYKKNE